VQKQAREVTNAQLRAKLIELIKAGQAVWLLIETSPAASTFTGRGNRRVPVLTWWVYRFMRGRPADWAG